MGAHLKDVLNPVNVDFDVWHQRDTRVAIRANDRLACERPNIYICEVNIREIIENIDTLELLKLMLESVTGTGTLDFVIVIRQSQYEKR